MFQFNNKQLRQLDRSIYYDFAVRLKPMLQEMYPLEMLQIPSPLYEQKIIELITEANIRKIQTEQDLVKFILINFQLGFYFWNNPENEAVTRILNSRYVPIDERLTEIVELVLP